MKRHLFIITLVASTVGHAATLSGGPDAWSRGSLGTAYFGWDTFEANTPQRGPGSVRLNDATPDIGTALTTSTLVQAPSTTYGFVSSSGNLYSGFTGNQFDIDLTFSALNSSGSGTTTIYLSILGNPATGNILLPFSLSYGSTTLSPTVQITGLQDQTNSQRVWLAEWQVPGNTATEYTINVLSDLASGNGTDVAIDSITVDAAWTNSSAALTNQSSALSLGNVNLVPEPSTLLLGLLSFPLMILRRR